MLLIRSQHTFKLLLLFLLINCSVYGQSYDGEYDDDDHSSYEESDSSDGPDYSKYYSVDSGSVSPAAGLTDVRPDTGFVSPAEFSSFFPSFYAASNKQEVTKQPANGFVNSQDFQSGFADFKASPFGSGARDFFEQAAQVQKQKELAKNKEEENDKYEIKPGPSYVSHKIVPPGAKKSKYDTELDDLNKPYNYKIQDNQEEKLIPLYSGTKQKVVDPKYLPQYAVTNPNNLTPYQKYSFQGQPQILNTFASGDSGRLTSTPTLNVNTDYLYSPTNNDYKYSYDTAASNVNAKLKDLKDFKPSQLIKECKKINKHVPGTKKNSKPMDCYVCKDAKGANYEECFSGLVSESNPKNYYIETSKEYSEPSQVQNYNYNSRYKRYTASVNKEKDDAYDRLKKQSEKYYNNPDYDSTYKHPKSFEEEYRFGPEYFVNGEGGEEKSSSEQIAEQLLKSGENCQKVVKDGQTCMVCQNKKTGGNYEQCSYTNHPEEKKYAYVKQRKYNSEDEEPESSEEVESSEEPVSNTKPQQFYPKSKPQYKQSPSSQNQRQRQRSEQDENSDEVERIKPVNTHRKASEYTIPKHFASLKVQPESSESEETEESQPEHYEDYYYKPFSAESKSDEQREEAKDAESEEEAEETEQEPETHYGYYGEESKKDVEEVLAEFAKKDRSKCKKAEKNGMTCYLCTDKKGLQHEECMYVSESRPQSKYQAYHAQKQTDGREGAKQKDNDDNGQESKVKSVRTTRAETKKQKPESESITEGPKRRRPVKSVKSSDGKKSIKNKDVTLRLPDEDFEKVIAKNINPKFASSNVNPRKQRKNANNQKKDNEKIEEPPVEESKDQYRVEGEKGAFSHETEPVFSPKYGVTLPKFMLTRSEGEKVYDEYVQSKS